MGTYTFNASASNSGFIATQATSYATAREGTGTKTAFTTDPMPVGQYNFNNATYQCYEAFLEFDTSSLAGKTISSAVLKIYVTAKLEDVTYTIEARLFDFGASLTSADYVKGSDLGTTTLLATLASSAATTGGYRSFTNVAFPANVNTAGKTRIVVSSDHPRTNTAPAKNIDEYIQFTYASGANPPQLVITTPDEGSAVITAADASISATVSIETHGDANITTADATTAATAELIGTASGVLNIIAADATLSSTVGIETFAYIEITLDDASLSTTALVAKEGAADVTEADATVEAIAAWNFTGAAVITAGDATLATSTRAGIEGAVSVTLGDAILTASESSAPWPFIYDFPQSPLDGTWRYVPGDDTLRSDRMVGVRQTRPRYGGNYADVTFAIMLTSLLQREELDRFFVQDCKHGTRPFHLPDPETGTVEKWTWANAPTYQHMEGDAWRVECALRREAA